jgi:hypothetical protein
MPNVALYQTVWLIFGLIVLFMIVFRVRPR